MRVLVHHLGIGDALVLAGAVAILAKEGELIFPCLERNAKSVREIFQSVKGVEVHPISCEEEMLAIPGEQIRIGCFLDPETHRSGTWKGAGFDQWFYDQLEIPIEEKWGSFPWKFEPDRKRLIDPDTIYVPYAFVHDDQDRGFTIAWKTSWVDRFSPTAHRTITDWSDSMYYASEVHLINSAFLHVAEVLPLRPEQPKFLHRYARPWTQMDMPKLRHNWTILD